MKKIVIVRQGGLGDVLSTIPAVIALHRKEPGATIVYNTEERFKTLFEPFPFIKPGNLENLYKYKVTYTGKAKRCILGVGDFKPGDSKIVDKHPRGLTPDWIVEKVMEADQVFDISYRSTVLKNSILKEWGKELNVEVTKQDIQDYFYAVKVWIQKNQKVQEVAHYIKTAAQDKKIVVIQAGSTSNYRVLPFGKLKSLIDKLSEDTQVVLVGDTSGIYGILNKGIMNTCGLLDLRQLIGAVAAADTVVAYDSGVLHLALLLQKPTIGLMGPSRKGDRFKDYLSYIRFVNARKCKCSPCWFNYSPECHERMLRSKQTKCMNSIPVTTINREVRRMFFRNDTKIDQIFQGGRGENIKVPPGEIIDTRFVQGGDKSLPDGFTQVFIKDIITSIPTEIGNEKLSIIVLTRNQLTVTKKCIQALENNKDCGMEVEIIVVDNHSSDSTIKWLSTRNVKIIGNGLNKGVAKARNQGAEAATGDYLLFLDNDQIISKNTLQKYLAKINSFDLLGIEHWTMHEDGNPTPVKFVKDFDIYDYVGGGGLVVKKETFNKLAGFDEIFSPAYYEDSDFSFRAKRERLNIGVLHGSNIKHIAHSTLRDKTLLDFDPQKVGAKSKKKFLKRWKRFLCGSSILGVEAKDVTIGIYITTWNREKTVERAIDSIAKQTRLPDEVLLIDDGSEDNTVAIAKRALKRLKNEVGIKNVRLIRTKENKGIGFTSRKVMDYMTSDLIGCLDSDDELLPKAVHHVLKVYYKNPFVGFFYTNYINQDGVVGTQSKQITTTFNNYSERKMISSQFKVWSRESYNKTDGFNPKLRGAVDFDLALKLEEVTRCLYIDKPLYVIHKGRSSMNLQEQADGHRKALTDAKIRRMRKRSFKKHKVILRVRRYQKIRICKSSDGLRNTYGYKTYLMCKKVLKQEVAPTKRYMDGVFIIDWGESADVFKESLLEIINRVEPDVVIVHQEPNWYVPIVKTVCDDLKIPWLFEVHDMTSHRLPLDQISQKELFGEKVGFEESHGIIVVTPSTVSWAKQRYDITAPWITIPSTPSLNMLPKNKLPKKQDGTHIVYMGGVSTQNWRSDIRYRYNLPQFQEITKQGINVHVYPNSFNLIKDVEYGAETRKNSRLHIYTPLPFDELMETITQYHFGICTWNIESSSKSTIDFVRTAMPNRFWDFLGAGLPVIVHNNPTIGEIAEDYGFGFQCDDLEKLKEKINNFGKNKTIPDEKIKLFMMDNFAWKLDKLIRFVMEDYHV